MKVIDRELNLEYTIIGHTSLPREFKILLKGSGIKKAVSQLKGDEDLRITVSENSIDITAVRHEEDSCGSDVRFVREKSPSRKDG